MKSSLRLVHRLSKSPFTSQLSSPSPILPGSGSSASGSAWRPARCHRNSPCRSETRNNDLRSDIYALEVSQISLFIDMLQMSAADCLDVFPCLLLQIYSVYYWNKQVSPCSCGWPCTSPCLCVRHKSAAAHETVERKTGGNHFRFSCMNTWKYTNQLPRSKMYEQTG